jgi:hypothetical protein
VVVIVPMVGYDHIAEVKRDRYFEGASLVDGSTSIAVTSNGQRRRRFDSPRPTDTSHVSCEDCWRAAAHMADILPQHCNGSRTDSPNIVRWECVWCLITLTQKFTRHSPGMCDEIPGYVRISERG